MITDAQVEAEAIKAGCTAADIHLACSFPECQCKQTPTIVRAALAAAQAAGAERDKVMMARGAEFGFAEGIEAAAEYRERIGDYGAEGQAAEIRVLSPPASAETQLGVASVNGDPSAAVGVDMSEGVSRVPLPPPSASAPAGAPRYDGANWRKMVEADVRTVVHEWRSDGSDAGTWDLDVLAREISECIPSPDSRNSAPAGAPSEEDVARLKEFVRWVIQEGPFNGRHLDGSETQDKAAELGILQRTTYDPELHGESSEAEPGDDWFVFASYMALYQDGKK